MQFRFLGSLEIVTTDGRSLALSSSKTGQVLGLLLARCPETVSAEVFIQELWGERPPRSAVTTLQTYIYHARRALDRELAIPRPGLVLTRPPGYAIQAAESDADGKVFETMVRQGRSMLDQGRTEAAATHLRGALALWRGPAFAGIPVGEVLRAHVAHLEELRVQAAEMKISAERRLGRHLELVAELRGLVARHPLNETFHGHLIEVLHESGRRAEALEAYQNLRRVLHRELGVEPVLEIQRLQQAVLRGGADTGARLLSST